MPSFPSPPHSPLCVVIVFCCSDWPKWSLDVMYPTRSVVLYINILVCLFFRICFSVFVSICISIYYLVGQYVSVCLVCISCISMFSVSACISMFSMLMYICILRLHSIPIALLYANSITQQPSSKVITVKTFPKHRKYHMGKIALSVKREFKYIISDHSGPCYHSNLCSTATIATYFL